MPDDAMVSEERIRTIIASELPKYERLQDGKFADLRAGEGAAAVTPPAAAPPAADPPRPPAVETRAATQGTQPDWDLLVQKLDSIPEKIVDAISEASGRARAAKSAQKDSSKPPPDDAPKVEAKEVNTPARKTFAQWWTS